MMTADSTAPIFETITTAHGVIALLMEPISDMPEEISHGFMHHDTDRTDF
jgi:hypothetical protein